MIHPETHLRLIRTKTVLFCLIVLLVSSSIGDVPLLLNYQGKLTDGSGLPLEDPVSITFSLWDSPTGGNKIWEQTIALVDPTHGIFAVELDISAGWETGYNINQFDIGVSYLQLEVDAVILSPREKMTSTVNAINIADSMVTTPKIRDASVTAAKLADGGIVDQLLEWNSTLGNWELVPTSGIAIDDDWIIDGSNQYSAVTGNVGIGTTSPAHKLDVQVDDGTDERVARIWNRSDDFGEDGLLVSTDRQASDAYILNAFSGGSGGSSKFFIRSDGNVGVGITTPTYRFQVAGSARLNSLNINGAYDFPTVDGASGNALVTNGLGTVSWSEVGSDNDWTEVGLDIERQSGDVYIGDDHTTNNNLYISGVIYDWDNTTYFIDPGSASRMNEIQFDEGSVSDPPIWFEGEDNTGIFQPADDMIGVTINGSEALRVDNLGNVGIGTTTPSAKLEVANSDAVIHGHTIGRGASSIATNVALGNLALSSNTTGQYNIAIGSEALKSNTTGISNIAIGRQALDANIGGAGSEGHANVAIGDQALTNNQSGGTNVAIGRFSLMSNVSGSSNSAVGHQTLGSNVSGSNNTAIGYWALVNNTGNYNTAVGSRLLFLNTTGEENTGIGYAASTNNSTSSYNTAVGSRALYNNSAGNNTAVGRSSLYNSTTGSSNTALGYMSGYSLTPSLTSGNNTFLGANTGYSDGTISNATAVGANVTLAQSNTVILGNNANVGIGTNTPAYKLDVNGDIAVSGGLFDGENTGSASEVLTADGSGGMSWEPAGGGGGSDNDWYEVGGTTPPDDITDNMYHTGNVAIGSADPGTYKLYVDGEAFVKTPTTGATSDGPAASTNFLLGEPSAQSASGNFKVYSYKGSGGVSYGGSGDNWGSQIIVSDAPLSGEGTSSSHLSIAVNSLTSSGVVTAGTGNPDKVWGTDGSGNPGWRNPSGGANQLNELTDVEVSDYTAGDLLIADGTDSYDGIALSGDASITSAGILTVNAIQGNPIATTDPTDGQILKWNDTASEWRPATDADGANQLNELTDVEVSEYTAGDLLIADGTDSYDGIAMSGDASITSAGILTVNAIQGDAISTTDPTDGQILKWNNTASEWQASDESGGGIGGSGTNGRIARFTPDGTTLGNSTFRDDGTTVGLNAAQTSANMLYIQDDRAVSAKEGLFVDAYTSDINPGDIVGLVAKSRATAFGDHDLAGVIGVVDGSNAMWSAGVMAVNQSGSSTPPVPSVLTALYADGSNNWAWSGWFTGGHVAISRATSTQTGELHFQDLDGTALANYVGFKAPTALSSNYVYTLPASFPASSGQVLSSTTAGVLSWTSAGGSDNLGDHTATENLQMSGHWVSNDGGDEGLLIDTDGNVTIKGNLLPQASGYNIGSTTERFDKIYASTIYADQIDPIVQIEGEQYVTWMSEGIGMLMETAGTATLANGIYAVDLATQPRGSDLWLFYNVVAENSIIPIITPQDRAYLIAYMEGSVLKVEALSGNENARFSYLLKGKRRDWAGKPIEDVNLPKEKISQPVNMDNYDKNGNLK